MIISDSKLPKDSCNYELISCFVISTELINIEREADFFFFLQHTTCHGACCSISHESDYCQTATDIRQTGQ